VFGSLLVLSALIAGCADDGGDASPAPSTTVADETRYPGAEWDVVDPLEAGFDPDRLQDLADTAEAAASTCLVVVRDGAVVDERYWAGGAPDVPREAFSVTKSVTSTLVGIAQDDGALDIEDPAATYIPSWAGTPSADVTIRNLLSNDSGREWSLDLDYREMAALAPDKTAFAVGLGQDEPPGTVWAYNNSAIQTLDAVLEAATGTPMHEFAQERLLDPIGMASSEIRTDQSGSTFAFMGLQTTCLDLARFGHLALNHGRWEDGQVISADYLEEATGRSSTDLNAAYGYLWWLNRPGPIASPAVATGAPGEGSVADGQIDPAAPEDVFWALGFRDQIVAVIPSEGIVAVRMGDQPPAAAPLTQATFTDAVLAALVE
jgi:CubicO group peptidase (beta-lactamase class C family)